MEDQKIYIGPSVPALGLLRNQVYLRGIPGEVKSAIAQFPEIEEFIVPISELTLKLREIETPGEHLRHQYKELMRKVGKSR